MKKIYLIFGFAAIAFASCKPNISPNKPVKGDADFSVYVSVGNSLTAGYADNSLYRTGQLNSYPSMLAQQFKQVGGGDFIQPLLPGDAGYPSAKLVLGYTTSCAGVTSLGPMAYTGTDTAGNALNVSSQGPFNNVGIPGIRCVDYITPGYGLFNPYAGRFFSNASTESALDEATKIHATFFTLWLGANDVLGYATSGGSGTVGGSGTSDISPVARFTTVYDSVVNRMTSNGAKGVLINVPDITSIPFFTTVPAKGLVLTKGQADSLTTGYATAGLVSFTFTAGANYFIIEDDSQPVGFRKITDGEYILLTVPQDSLVCAGWGSKKPIPKQYVLSADEVANVKTATTAFNQVIQSAATAHNLPVADMNSYIKSFGPGIEFNGVTFSTTFVTGGAFSLDGVHLTPRGYALAANYILTTINSFYHSTIPMLDVNAYSGVKFP